MAHEGVELGLGLDHGGHVVMIAERHALVGAPFAEFGDLARIGPHFVIAELRLGGQRLAAITLDRATDFAIDDARRVDGLEQVDHRLDARLVGGEVFVDQRAGKPATA
jgi:hypothetical protein